MSGIDIRRFRRDGFGHKSADFVASRETQRTFHFTIPVPSSPQPTRRRAVAVQPRTPAPLHSHRARVYVPPVGSYAALFLGRVIAPVGV